MDVTLSPAALKTPDRANHVDSLPRVVFLEQCQGPYGGQEVP